MLFLVKMFLDSRSLGIQFCLTDFPDSYLFPKEMEMSYCFFYLHLYLPMSKVD